MKILSTIISAALLLQVSVCTNIAAAADTINGATNIDSQPVEVSLAGCGVKKRHAARQVRQYSGTNTERSYSASSTEKAEPQTVTVPLKCPQACPTTTVVQPAVVEAPVCQPAVVVGEHRSLWPLLVIGAAVIATAITLPIVLTHHHHHNNDALIRQRQLLLLQRATP